MEQTFILCVDIGTFCIKPVVLIDNSFIIHKVRTQELKVPSSVIFQRKGNLIEKKSSYEEPNVTDIVVKGYNLLLDCTFMSVTDSTLWIENLVRDVDDFPKIKVARDKSYYPDELLCMSLENIKNKIEKEEHCEINQLVITQPASYSIKCAALLCGLEISHEIPEALAISFAFKDYLQNRNLQITDDKLLMAIDLGASSLSFYLINVNNEESKIYKEYIDTKWSCTEFTLNLYNFLLHKNTNSTTDVKFRLEQECERIKILLSEKELYHQGEIKITRKTFEKQIQPIVNRILCKLKGFMMSAKKSKDCVTDIILIGGSSKIPIVRKSIESYFEKECSIQIDPEYIVAYGAAACIKKFYNAPNL